MGRSTPSFTWSKQRRPALSEQDPQRNGRERLARISHHFLSEETETTAPYRLTLLGAAPCTTLLCPALARALCRQGVPAIQLPPAVDGVYATFKGDEAGTNPAAELTLLTLEPAELAIRDSDGRLLLMTGANANELEQAYLFCKGMLTGRHGALPGITFTGCCGQRQAEQGFHHLASTVQRFLGQSLLSYTYLPPLEPDPGAWHHQVMNLAALIAADWRQHRAPSTATSTDIGRN